MRPNRGTAYVNDVHTALFSGRFRLLAQWLNELRAPFARYVDMRRDLQPARESPPLPVCTTPNSSSVTTAATSRARDSSTVSNVASANRRHYGTTVVHTTVDTPLLCT